MSTIQVDQDDDVEVLFVTPGGLVLTMQPEQIAVADLRQKLSLPEFDGQTASWLWNLSRCMVTIKRTKQTTARANA